MNNKEKNSPINGLPILGIIGLISCFLPWIGNEYLGTKNLYDMILYLFKSDETILGYVFVMLPLLFFMKIALTSWVSKKFSFILDIVDFITIFLFSYICYIAFKDYVKILEEMMQFGVFVTGFCSFFMFLELLGRDFYKKRIIPLKKKQEGLKADIIKDEGEDTVEKELQMMKIEEQKEKLNKKKKAKQKRRQNIKAFQKQALNIWDSLKKILVKYFPIFFEKVKILGKNIGKTLKKYSPIVISKARNITKNISQNVKEIDIEKYKESSAENLKKIKQLKIKRKYINLLLVLLLLFFLISIGNYLYNNFYYRNQIIIVGDEITLKEQPESITYFNNNNVKI